MSLKLSKTVLISFIFALFYNSAALSAEEKEEQEQKFISNYKYNVKNKKIATEQQTEQEKKAIKIKEDEDKKKRKTLRNTSLGIYADFGFQANVRDHLNISQQEHEEEDFDTIVDVKYAGFSKMTYGMNIGAGVNIYPFSMYRMFYFGFKANYLSFFNNSFRQDSAYNARLNNFITISALIGLNFYGKLEAYFFFGGGAAFYSQNTYVKYITNNKNVNFGFTLGFGLNFYITKNWSVAIEYIMPLIDIDSKHKVYNQEMEYRTSLRPQVLCLKARYNFFV